MPTAPADDVDPRLLVVSHSAAATVNQLVHEAVANLGWEVHLVLPDVWIDDFDGGRYDTDVLPALRARSRRLPVILPGRPQRHLYRAAARSVVDAVAPAVAFLEQEPFSASAWQWAGALRRAGIPFVLTQAENLDRRLPAVARLLRARTLPHAAAVAVRSPSAGALMRGMRTELICHPVPDWPLGTPRPAADPFVVGYAGRLVQEKGVLDLLDAVETMEATRLLLVGDGPLRERCLATARATGRVELLTGVRHDAMPDVYGRMDVLALPSRTTPTWTEQFGRVLVEALWCGVPVIGSDSGEIPWVIESTGGGMVVAEGDVPALRNALRTLRDHPDERRRLAATGSRHVQETYSVTSVARRLDRLLHTIA